MTREHADPEHGQRVVVVNGPAGVGKTTMARALAAGAENAACIHGDQLRDFVVARRSHAVQRGLGYRNGATLATNFIEGGYELVVFEYVFESPASVTRFLSAYTAHAPVHFFTLWAPLDVVRERELSRPGRERLGERVTACHAAIERHLGALGPVVPTAGRPVAAVVADLLARCARGEGLRTPAAQAGAVQLAGQRRRLEHASVGRWARRGEL